MTEKRKFLRIEALDVHDTKETYDASYEIEVAGNRSDILGMLIALSTAIKEEVGKREPTFTTLLEVFSEKLGELVSDGDIVMDRRIRQ